MPRTTSGAVALIIEVDDSISLTPYIEAASQMVTDNCTSSSYSDAKLELIERWLSAHFYAVRDMRPASEGAGGVSVSYQNRVDLFLANTMYGQQAMALDSAGNLANLNKRLSIGAPAKPGIKWLGKRRPC